MSPSSRLEDPEAWRIQFFCRHPEDDPSESVPALAFLESLPSKVAAEFHAVLDAVAEAPPPSFSGGGKWQAMHGNMSGFFEVRVRGGRMNHRLFCLLERDARDLGGPSIICIAGLSKPPRSPAREQDYRRVRSLGAEFLLRRRVLP